MMIKTKYCVGLLWAVMLSWHAFPATAAFETLKAKPPHVSIELLSDLDKAAPGSTILIGLKFDLEKDWHIYWKFPGDAGIPTKIDWRGPPSVHLSKTLWPRPKIFDELGDIKIIGYAKAVLFLTKASVPLNWPMGTPLTISVKVNWLACKVACIPGQQELRIVIPTAAEEELSPTHRDLFQDAQNNIPTAEEEQILKAHYRSLRAEGDFLASIGGDSSWTSTFFWGGLVFAFLGGLILNVMPCVLPVLSIKVFRFLKQRGATKKDLIWENIHFGTGILFSFLLLAGIVIGLKAAGQQVGWGFQFQEPRFLIAFSAIVFGFALSLFGVFDVSLALPSQWTQLTGRGGWAGPFWEGILISALATPCTAPFLGPALGFAFSQPPLVILLFFLSIGLGLASPYLLLALYPAWTRFLPKPGPWMESFRQFMGFPLVGTVIWLLWILGRQTGNSAVTGTLIFLFALSLGLWMIGRWSGAEHRRGFRWVTRLIAISLTVFSYVWFVEPRLKAAKGGTSSPSNGTLSETIERRWTNFSLKSLKDHLDAGETVFVDFTADWCLTCQFNKRTVLYTPEMMRFFAEKKVVLIKADWTHRDEEISKVLDRLGRSGVPVYVIFPKGEASRPIFLPEVLTRALLRKAINRIN